MGNYISILVGCVGAVELLTFLHQITLRAELEHDREQFIDSILNTRPDSESSGGASNAESVPTTTNVTTSECNQDSTTSGSESTAKPVKCAAPEIRFEEYERSQSMTDGVLPVVDGLKIRHLVRDDGTGRRKTVKKRNSSIDSKLTREEELRMFTSLEEEEFSSLSEDFVPISYNSGSSDSTARTKKHHRRHKKSPVNETRRASEDSSSSKENLPEPEETDENSKVTYPWGDINPGHHKNQKLWDREKAMSIEELQEDEDKCSAKEVPSETKATIIANSNDDTDKRHQSKHDDVVNDESVSKNRIIVSIESAPEAAADSFACEDHKEEKTHVGDDAEEEATESHRGDESVSSSEAKVEDWLVHVSSDINLNEPQNHTDSDVVIITEPEDDEDDEEVSDDEDIAFYVDNLNEVIENPKEIRIVSVDDESSGNSYLELTNSEKADLLTNIGQKGDDVKTKTQSFLDFEKLNPSEEITRKVSFVDSESGKISECHSTVRNVTPESLASVDTMSDSFVLVDEVKEITSDLRGNEDINDFSEDEESEVEIQENEEFPDEKYRNEDDRIADDRIEDYLIEDQDKSSGEEKEISDFEEVVNEVEEPETKEQTDENEMKAPDNFVNEIKEQDPEERIIQNENQVSNEFDEDEDEIQDFNDIIKALKRNSVKDEAKTQIKFNSFPTKYSNPHFQINKGEFPKEISALLTNDDEEPIDVVARVRRRQDSIKKKIIKENTDQYEQTGHHPRYNMPLPSIDMSIRLIFSNQQMDDDLKFFPLNHHMQLPGNFPTYKTEEKFDDDDNEDPVDIHLVPPQKKKKKRFEGPKLELTVIDEEGQQNRSILDVDIDSATPDRSRRSPSPFIADRNDPIMILLQDSMSIP